MPPGLNCHVCGAPMRLFSLSHSSPWHPGLWWRTYGEMVTACSADPSHNTADSYLDRVRCEMEWDDAAIG